MNLDYADVRRSRFAERIQVRARCLGRSTAGDEWSLRAVIDPERRPFAGADVTVRVPGAEGKPVSARIVEINDHLRVVDETLELIAAVSARICPVLPGKVDLFYQTGAERESLGVPVGTLVRAAMGDFVYEDTGDRLRRRRVKVGAVNDGRAEILSGLKDGARVVVNGARRLWILELALVGGMGNLENVKEAN